MKVGPREGLTLGKNDGFDVAGAVDGSDEVGVLEGWGVIPCEGLMEGLVVLGA